MLTDICTYVYQCMYIRLSDDHNNDDDTFLSFTGIGAARHQGPKGTMI